MKPVGIDLGTTNSVIAVAEQVAGVNKKYIFGQVAVLPDKHNRGTLPSAVAWGPDDCNQPALLTGYEAKEIVNPPPARFAKRMLDTDLIYRLGPHTLSPKDVSCLVLKKLITIAEARLGKGRVGEAVITVPAHFGNPQRVLTAQAGEEAGLKVKKVLLEPIAAALAYDHLHPQRSNRILVYDLGGGTFDVTILDKKEGSYQAIKCGGDRELGGYDFDKKLAYLLLQRLVASNYALGLDLLSLDTKADHARIWAQLLILAERVKMNLSDDEVTTVRKMEFFSDLSGTVVNIVEQVSREEYEALIEPEVNRTMEITQATLDQSGVNPRSIDRLLLVGGSSYTPLIRRRLKERFGWMEQELFEPDLCVAIGAALEAAGTTTERNQHIMLELPTERETNQTTLMFAGKVQGVAESAKVVHLRRQDEATPQTAPLNADHTFVFRSVRLLPNQENIFSLSVPSQPADPLTVKIRQVTRVDATATAGLVSAPIIDVPEQLAKPLFVQTVKGLVTLMDEGTPLPRSETITRKTVGQGRFLLVKLFEGGVSAGQIRIDNLPAGLQDGLPVEVTITVGKGFRIKAQAELKVTGQSFTGQTTFDCVPLKILPHNLQTAEFARMQQNWSEKISPFPSGSQRGTLSLEEGKLRIRAQNLLKAMPPDLVASQRAVNRYQCFLDTMPPFSEWIPAEKERFDRHVKKLQTLIVGKEQVGHADEIEDKGYARTLAQLVERGNRLWQAARETRAWRDTAKSLTALERMIRQVGETNVSPPQTQSDPIQLRSQALAEMHKSICRAEDRAQALVEEGVLSRAEVDAQLADFKQQQAGIEQKLRQVDLRDANSARNAISGIYQTDVDMLTASTDEFSSGAIMLE